MPRKDRTFSEKDVIRIVNQHLSPEERANVILGLCEGVKIEDFGLGPVLVPSEVDLTAIEETNLIEILVQIVTGAFISKLPGFITSLIDSVIGLDEFETAVRKVGSEVAKGG